MRFEMMTSGEVVKYLERFDGINLSVVSTGKYGSMGHIRTDTLCTEAIAMAIIYSPNVK